MTAFEIGLVLASALLHAWWSFAIKRSRDPLIFNLLQKPLPVATLLLLSPWLHLSEVAPSVWAIFAATSVAHSLYLLWMGRAYESGDLTLVYPIARSTPAFLPFIAVPLLGEHVSPAGALGIAVVVLGMWCVQLGRGARWSAIASPAAGFAWLTLGTTVAYSLLDKSAMQGLAAGPWSSPVPRAAFFCLALTAGSGSLYGPFVLHRRGWRRIREVAREELPTAAFAAALSFVGYGLILHALETAPASYVVTVRQTSVLFALVLGVVLLRERPGRLRILGASATVAGVALIGLAGD